MYIDRYWDIEFSLWRTSSRDSLFTKCSPGIQGNAANLSRGKMKLNTNRKFRNKSKGNKAIGGLIHSYYKTLQKIDVFQTGGSYKGTQQKILSFIHFRLLEKS